MYLIDDYYLKLIKYINVTWNDCFIVDNDEIIEPIGILGYILNEVDGLLYSNQILTLGGFIELCMLIKNKLNDKNLVNTLLHRLNNELNLDNNSFNILYNKALGSFLDNELKNKFIKDCIFISYYVNEQDDNFCQINAKILNINGGI